ncbi:hypothetical protein L0F63_006265 [Massospora cicadina]|nr:hypothetical protein L0F63_006265 [Massospora cicadina]
MSISGQVILRELATCNALTQAERVPTPVESEFGLNQSSEGSILDFAESTSSSLFNMLGWGNHLEAGRAKRDETLVIDLNHLAYVILELSQLHPNQLSAWRQEALMVDNRDTGGDRWWALPKSLASIVGLDITDKFLYDLRKVYTRLLTVRSLKIGRYDPRNIFNRHGVAVNFSHPVSLELFCHGKLERLQIVNLSPHQLTAWSSIAKRLRWLACTESLSCPTEIINQVDPIPGAGWEKLTRIEFNNNGLTKFPMEAAHRVVRCHTLALSRNRFVEVPDGLRELFMLHALDLSFNRISTALNIDHILGNVHTLDLRHNQLTQLHGLHRLWALESLDVRDNLVGDVAEVGRLASLPSLVKLRVANNPFCNEAGYVAEMTEYFGDASDLEVDGQKLARPEPHPRPTPPELNQASPKPNARPEKLPPPARGKVLRRVATIRSASEVEKEAPSGVTSHPGKVDTGRNSGARAVRLTDSDELQLSSGLQPPLATVRGSGSRGSGSEAKPLRRGVPNWVPNWGRTSPLSANCPIPHGDAFRKRIEAMRKEAGATWLKVLNEAQKQSQPPKPTRANSPSQDELTTFNASSANPKFEYLLPQNSSLEFSPPSSIPETIREEGSSADEVPGEAPTEAGASEGGPQTHANGAAPESAPLPEGEPFEVLREGLEVDSGRRVRHADVARVVWVMTGAEVVEADAATGEVLGKWGYASLMRVVLPHGKPHCIRAEFKPSRYDAPAFYDVSVIDPNRHRPLLGLLKAVVRGNLERGLIHDRYKRAKCLACGWLGVPPDKFVSLARCGVTPFPELEIDAAAGSSLLNLFHLGAKKLPFEAAEEGARGCPGCKGTFLVEFYGREKPEPSAIPSLASLPAQASSKLMANLGSLLGSKPTRPADKPKGDSQPPSRAPAWVEALPGYQPTPLPFQALNNALRLHIDLRVLEREGESLASWLAATYVPQAPVFYDPPPPKWSLRAYTGHAEPLPETMPPELPLYLLLSSQCLYLFTPDPSAGFDPDPETLQLKHRLALGSIARIDVGCNRQTLTFHFRLHAKNPKSGVYDAAPRPVAEQLPQTSYTVLVRDKGLCTRFLDSLLEILYESGLGKVVNHDVLWAVRNLREGILLRPHHPSPSYRVNGQALPAAHLPRDCATLDDVVVDRVTYDFLKFVGQVAHRRGDGTLGHAVLVVTDTFIYLCTERYHVWPPAVTGLEALGEYAEPEAAPHRLACLALPQYSPIEALAINHVGAVLTYEVSLSCYLSSQPKDLEYPIVSFKAAVDVYGKPPPPLSPRLVPLPLPPEAPPEAPSSASWHLLFTSLPAAQEFLEVLHLPEAAPSPSGQVRLPNLPGRSGLTYKVSPRKLRLSFPRSTFYRPQHDPASPPTLGTYGGLEIVPSCNEFRLPKRNSTYVYGPAMRRQPTGQKFGTLRPPVKLSRLRMSSAYTSNRPTRVGLNLHQLELAAVPIGNPTFDPTEGL